jgi:hypothetical protein
VITKISRVLVLPIMLGAAIMLLVAATYCGLEALLASYADYDRGLWEGMAIVLAINGGNALANLVLKRVDARKKESA